MYNLKDKVIWISGASSGIGEHIARDMTKRGAKVILSARRREKLEQLQSELGSEQSAVLEMDVTHTDDLVAKHNEAQTFFGPIDILVNNAGITQRSSVEETDLIVDRKMFEVNYFGNVALSKAVLPSMLERKIGRIVVISSVAGKLGVPFRSTYCATKHALQGYYDALRAEVSNCNIQVHIICPGYIKTDISLHALNAKGEKHGKMDKGQAQGMPVELCAQKITNAILNNKKEVHIGRKEANAVRVRKFLPNLYYKLMAKRAQEQRF